MRVFVHVQVYALWANSLGCWADPVRCWLPLACYHGDPIWESIIVSWQGWSPPVNVLREKREEMACYSAISTIKSKNVHIFVLFLLLRMFVCSSFLSVTNFEIQELLKSMIFFVNNVTSSICIILIISSVVVVVQDNGIHPLALIFSTVLCQQWMDICWKEKAVVIRVTKTSVTLLSSQRRDWLLSPSCCFSGPLPNQWRQKPNLSQPDWSEKWQRKH